MMLSLCHFKYLVRQFLKKFGVHLKPSTYQRQRKKALHRDNYTCQTCGFRSRRKNTIHHINKNHNDNRLENLITECRSCHDKIDGIVQTI